MPDYKEMYLTMIKASEQAISVLIDAQRQAEEIYIATPVPDIAVLPTAAEQSE